MEAQVVQKVIQLFTSPGTANKVSQELEQTAGDPESFSLLLNILRGYGGHSDVQLVRYDSDTESMVTTMVAQMVRTQLQAGIQLLGSVSELWTILKSVVALYRTSHPPVLRQLSLSVCAVAVLGTPQWAGAVLSIVRELRRSQSEAFAIQVLTDIPEEMINSKIVMTPQDRQATADTILADTSEVWEILEDVCVNSADDTDMQVKCLRCFCAWLKGHNDILAANNAANPPLSTQAHNATHQLFCSFQSCKIFLRVRDLCRSTDPESQLLGSDILTQALDLPSGIFADAMQVLLQISDYVILLNQTIRSSDTGVQDVPTTSCRAFLQVMEKFAATYYIKLMCTYPGDVQRTLMGLSDSAGDMLLHPDMSMVELSLDVWYSMMNTFFGTDGEEKQEVYDSRRECERGVLIPIFQRVLELIIQVIQYPENIEHTLDTFDFEAWGRLRELCAKNLMDMIMLLGCDTLIDRAGGRLQEVVIPKLQQGHPIPWPEMEACFFVLTTVAPRAPAGGDNHIPMALRLLASIQYPDNGIQSIIIRAAAGRLILWTAGYVGAKRALFRDLFSLVDGFIEFVARPPPTLRVNYRTHPATRSYVDGVEFLLVEALNAIGTSAAATLTQAAEAVSEGDLAYVLDRFSTLILIKDLKLVNRCAIVAAAGSVLSFLPRGTLLSLHNNLVRALHGKVHQSRRFAPDAWSPRDALKLALAALEAVNPMEEIPVPTSSSEPPPDSPQMHPVLLVLTDHWSLVDTSLGELGQYEGCVEAACHAVTNVFNITRRHCTKYNIFYRYLDKLSESYCAHPAVFHLASLRTLIGVFGRSSENNVTDALCRAVERCIHRTLSQLKEQGLERQPDLIGISIDTMNVSLVNATMASKLIPGEAFRSVMETAVEYIPKCDHPKVLTTLILSTMRYICWLGPEQQLCNLPGMTTSPGWWSEYVDRAHMASKEFANQTDGIRGSWKCRVLRSLVDAVATIYTGNAEWIGIIGSIFMMLLRFEDTKAEAVETLRSKLDELETRGLSHATVVGFYNDVTVERNLTNPRTVCRLVQAFADAANGDWRKHALRSKM